MSETYEYLYSEETNNEISVNENEDWETFYNRTKNKNQNATAPPPEEKIINTNQIQVSKYDLDKLIGTNELNYDQLISSNQSLQNLGQHLNINQLKKLCLHLESAIQVGLNKSYIVKSDGLIDLKSISNAYNTSLINTAFKLGYCLADLINKGLNIDNFIEEYGSINSFIIEISNISKNNEDFLFNLLSLDNLNNIDQTLEEERIIEIRNRLNISQIKSLKWKCDFWNIIV